jgi:predicted DNA-binding transcriptional regulator AlpA
MTTLEHESGESKRPRPLLIDIKTVAVMLGRSEASVRRDDEAGRIPAPISLGGSKRWRIEELRAWIDAGCPGRPARDSRLPIGKVPTKSSGNLKPERN